MNVNNSPTDNNKDLPETPAAPQPKSSKSSRSSIPHLKLKGRKVTKESKSKLRISFSSFGTSPESPTANKPEAKPHSITTLSGQTTTFPAGSSSLLKIPHDLKAIRESFSEPPDSPPHQPTSFFPTASPLPDSSSLSTTRERADSSLYEQLRGVESKKSEADHSNPFLPLVKGSPRTRHSSIQSPVSKGVVASCVYGDGKFSISTTHHGNFAVVLTRPTIHLPKASGTVSNDETPLPIFQAWLSDAHAAEKRAGEKERIPYESLDVSIDIEPAITRFEREFNCSWSLLKQAFQSGRVTLKEMQIIQDLRAAYNMYILQRLKAHFEDQGLVFTAIDSGSPKLGSDTDLGLDVQAKGASLDELTSQTKQAEAIIQFNRHYERIWNHPSALIFDTNAYSKQSVRPIHDPVFNQESSIFQAQASLVMRMKLAPDTWNRYVEDVLNKISHKHFFQKSSRELAEKERELEEVAAQHQHLENALLVKMIEVAFVPKDPTPLETTRWQRFISELSATIDTPATQETVRTLVNEIKKESPDVEIWASNLLHEDTERRCALLEETRTQLLQFLNDMNEGDVRGKGTKYNELVQKLTGDIHMQEGHQRDAAVQAAHLRNLQILHHKQFQDKELTEELESKLVQCFRDLAALQEKKRKVEKVFNSLAACRNLVEKAKLKKDEPETHGNLLEIKTRLSKLHTDLLREIHDLNGDPAINIHHRQYKRAYKTVKRSLEKLTNQIDNLYLSPVGERVHAIYEMADNILLDVQKSTAIGQYYSQQGMMTLGAYAFVVNNLQQNATDVRSISQYCQALNELLAYYENHQKELRSPFEKLVEASKFGERSLLALEELHLKCKLLKIAEPDFSADLAHLPGYFTEKKLHLLQRFFNEILVIRKDKAMSPTKKQERLNAALAILGQHPDKEGFRERTLDMINTTMRALATTVEAWRSTISVQIQSA